MMVPACVHLPSGTWACSSGVPPAEAPAPAPIRPSGQPSSPRVAPAPVPAPPAGSGKLPADVPQPVAPSAGAAAGVSEEYGWREGLGPVSLSRNVPQEQKPQLAWLFEVAVVALKVAFNRSFTSTDVTLAEAASKLIGAVAAARVSSREGVLEEVLSAFGSLIFAATSPGVDASLAQNYDNYKALFSTLPVPWVAPYWRDDRVFGWMRVAGFNPTVMQRCPVDALDAVKALIPVEDGMLQAVTSDDDSLLAAAAEKRLYYADYSMMRGLRGGTFPHGQQKFVFAPTVVLAVGRGHRSLMPIAIRCVPDGPVFTPSDGECWQQAKLIAQSADGNHHELVAHLAHTHLIMEPITVSTYRNLPRQHALFRLLAPHCEGTIFINNKAAGSLIAPGGEIDTILAPHIEDSRELAAKARQSPGFNALMLPAVLARRHIADRDLPIEFPYRDDAHDVWLAISAWTAAYVDVFYASDEVVQKDSYLQQWARDIASPTGGNLPCFGEGADGSICTRAYLKDALTMIIFTASAQHAAVNFAQEQLLSFAPWVPAAIYGEAPSRDARRNTLEETMRFLPPLRQALTQIDLATVLGGVRYTRLGQYDDGQFNGIEPAPANYQTILAGGLRSFQTSLNSVHRRIQQRNATRMFKYEYLLPELIPQSINI